MRTYGIKKIWPICAFFLCQGASLFGISYAVLPLLLLLIWLAMNILHKGDLLTDLIRDNRIRWISYFYIIFLATVIVSDLLTGGKVTHLDGSLYNVAIGVYILLGYLIARSFDGDILNNISHHWFAFVLFLLLILVEFHQRDIYRFHHGVFVYKNILFSSIILVGLISLSLSIEYYNINKLLSCISVILVLWSFYSVYKYSISEVLPSLYAVNFLIILLLSEKKYLMYIFSLSMFSPTIFILSRADVLLQLRSVDLTSLDTWMKLLNERQYVWSAVIRMIGQYPFWGVGSGNFSTTCKKILIQMNASSIYETFAHAHNILLHNFAVHGVFAGTAFIAFLLSIFRLIFNAHVDREGTVLRLAVFGMWCVYVLYGLVDNALLYEEIIPLFWGSVGLFMGIAVKEGREMHVGVPQGKRYNSRL